MSQSTFGWILLVVMVVLGAGAGGAPGQEPDLAVQDQTQKMVDQLYGQAIKSVKSTRDPADDVKLAGEMVTQADKIPDSPDVQRVVYTVARDLAVRAQGGLKVSLTAVRKLTPEGSIERAQAECDVYQSQIRLVSSADRQKVAEDYVESTLRLADQLLAAQQTDEAKQRLTRVQSIARLASVRHAKRVSEKIIEARERALVEAETNALRKRVERDPTNADAALMLARKLIVEFGGYEEAAAVTAAAGEEVFAANARKVAGAIDAITVDEAEKLGDWLMGLPEANSTELGRLQTLRKAVTMYDRFLSLHELEDARRLLVVKKRTALAKQIPDVVVVAGEMFWAPMTSGLLCYARELVLPGDTSQQDKKWIPELVNADVGQMIGDKKVSARFAGDSGRMKQVGSTTAYRLFEVYSENAQQVRFQHPATKALVRLYVNGHATPFDAAVTFKQGRNIIVSSVTPRKDSGEAIALTVKGKELKQAVPGWLEPPTDAIKVKQWVKVGVRDTSGKPFLVVSPFKELEPQASQKVMTMLKHGDLRKVAPAKLAMHTWSGKVNTGTLTQTSSVYVALIKSPIAQPFECHWGWSTARRFAVVALNGEPLVREKVMLKPGINFFIAQHIRPKAESGTKLDVKLGPVGEGAKPVEFAVFHTQ